MEKDRQLYQLYKKAFEDIVEVLKNQQKIELKGAEVVTIQGLPGHTPTKEELLELIKPLIPNIPEVIHGKTPSREELLALIEPLIPEPRHGETPTVDKLLGLIKPLIPKVKDGETPSDDRLRKLILPLIPKIDVPVAPTADEIIKKLLDGEVKIPEEAIAINWDRFAGPRSHMYPAGGAREFISLTDTPDTYKGHALEAVRVNSDGTGLEFYIPVSSGTPTWGAIVGTLSNQTDLQNALNLKSDTSHTHTFASLTSKPTTLAGYGITDAAASGHTHVAANITDFNTAVDARISTHALALTDVYTVASQAAQLALTAQEGDVAIRSDISKTYIHNGGTAGTMADWSELASPTDAVTSVNGQTGVVVLNTSHIAESGNLYYTDTRARAAMTGAISGLVTTNLTASRALVSDASGKIIVATTTATEIGYVNGVTSAIQTQLNAKQATITGGATTIVSSNLTASRALASDTSGKVAVSAVTSTELGYVAGVTSAIQTQLNGKASSTHTHAQSDITNLVSDLAGKASATHTHAQSDITNLTTDLAAKANLSGAIFTGNVVLNNAGDQALTIAHDATATYKKHYFRNYQGTLYIYHGTPSASPNTTVDGTSGNWTMQGSLTVAGITSGSDINIQGYSIPTLRLKTNQPGTREWRLSSGYNDADSISLVDVTASNAQRIIVNQNGQVYLPAELRIASLAGILKATAGVVSVAVAGTDYAAASHAHSGADITSGTVAAARLGSGTADNTTFLRGDGAWTAISATVNWGSIGGTLSNQTDLNTALAGKASTSHTHAWADITSGLPTTLAGYGITDAASSSHTHAYSSLTSIPATFAPSAHTHPQSDITNLTTDLAAKQAQLNGTGFVKASGTTITYDNSTYLTTSAAASAYQPLDSDLTTIAGLTATTDNFIVAVSSAWASRTPAQVRTTLGLVIGTNVQAYSANLTTYAGIAPSANMQTFLGSADYAAMRTNLGLVIGTNVQAYSATLTSWAGKTVPTGTVIGTTDTQTMTNKRMTKRVGTVASSSTPTPSADDHDMYTVTALAAGATFGAPTGTPTDGQELWIRVKDNGSAQTLAFNAIYRALGITLPTTTVAGKTLYFKCMYNAADTKWDVLAYGVQA